MAKKNSPQEEQQRRTRKDELRERKQQEQLHVVRIGIAIVAVLIAAVLVFALINEFVIAPSRTIATVNGSEIALESWQDRVVYERAQRVSGLDDQLEAFGGDVGIIQQFAAQTLNELSAPAVESFGEAALDTMVSEELVRQAAEERGITVSEDEVEERIGEFFSYYGGESPTAVPSPTATIEPTPSLTPIPAPGEEVTEEEPLPEPTTGPTSTPLPTPTPVSSEAFQTEFSEFIANLESYGAKESVYRDVLMMQMLREQLTDALVEEQNVSSEAEHASFYYIVYSDQEEADAAYEEIQNGDFLTVWNTVRSAPPDETVENPPTASEVVWRSRPSIESSFGPEITEVVFTLPPNVPGTPIELATGEDPIYVLVYVSGLDVRELSESELQAQEQTILETFITDQRLLADIQIDEFWRSRVPTVPALDPKFLVAPTAAPTAEPTAAAEDGS